jgi:urease accessory protein
MGYEKARGKTCLIDLAHSGPLRIQRAFYPEGEACAHTYLLHPPGGLVNGDTIDIAIKLGEGTHSLITTPSAGKAYRSMSADLRQRQSVRCRVESDAFLEWMPLENIVFNGARADFSLDIDLAEDAKLFAWEFTCLGRPASDETFDHGELTQLMTVKHDNQLLYRERCEFQGASAVLSEPWGLNRFSCQGTLVCTYVADSACLQHLRDSVIPEQGQVVFSQRGDLLLARYLGHQAEQGRAAFEQIWRIIRPLMSGHEVCKPRIWST